MAKIKRSVLITFDDDFQKKIDNLGKQTDEILGKAMEAGAQAALPIVRGNLSWAIGNDTKTASRSTGELEESLGVSPVTIDNKGVINVKIGFNEPRKRQYVSKKSGKSTEVMNGTIANILENGKHGQPARPWLKRAKTQATKVFRDKAQKVIDEEVEKL